MRSNPKKTRSRYSGPASDYSAMYTRHPHLRKSPGEHRGGVDERYRAELDAAQWLASQGKTKDIAAFGHRHQWTAPPKLQTLGLPVGRSHSTVMPLA